MISLVLKLLRRLRILIIIYSNGTWKVTKNILMKLVAMQNCKLSHLLRDFAHFLKNDKTI